MASRLCWCCEKFGLDDPGMGGGKDGATLRADKMKRHPSDGDITGTTDAKGAHSGRRYPSSKLCGKDGQGPRSRRAPATEFTEHCTGGAR